MKRNEKTKELIAVGASITARCQPCLDYHLKKALKFGAEVEEILEAIEIGKRVRFIYEKAKSASYYQPTNTPSFVRCS
jgi:AhpD family alkylhydroperoxidase